LYASDGTLYVMSDRSGFWNIYKYQDGDIQLLLPEALEQEFGGPAWAGNVSDYSPLTSDASKIICSNKSSVAVLDTTARTLTDLPSPFRGLISVTTATVLGKPFVLLAGLSASKPLSIVSYDITQKKVASCLKDYTQTPLDEAYVSVSEEIRFLTKTGYGYCYFYPPKNPNFKGEGLPPLKIVSHGGPTSSCDGTYNLGYLYWTSRGFAVADVNYGGSTGYGREYRNRLHKNWGIVDVDDCCDAALYLAEKGYVDREKLTIKGSSAGGFTTL